MSNTLKNIFNTALKTIIIIALLEFVLYFVFNYGDKKRFDSKTQFIIETNSYKNLDRKIVKKIYDEMYEQDMEWVSFLQHKPMPYKGIYNNIDDNGHRKTINYKLIDSLETIKIFCFGGSTLFSTGARDNYTIPSELSKLLHKQIPNKNFVITNFGIHGYNRNMETILLQQELLKNNIPNVVIFYDGVNEILSAYQNNKAGEPTNAINSKREFKLGHSYTKKLKLIIETSNIKRFVTYLQTRIFKTKSYEIENTETLSEDVAKNYLGNIKISDALASQYNFKVINFLQPVIFTKNKLSKYEKIMAEENNFYKKLYDNSYEIVKKDTTVSLYDISTIFNTNETIYTDFCHTAEKGNYIVASEVFKKIEPILTTKKLK